MLSLKITSSVALAVTYLTSILSSSPLSLVNASPTTPSLKHLEKRATLISPKVFIISMFSPEAAVWYGIPEFNLLALNISITGFSPLFPYAHCTANGEVCQMITGESEINAAASVSALVLSPYFNLTKTYFMVAGIAGINPEVATTGAVTFAKYAVQVALQYEFDAREIPANFTTGYFPFNTESPDEYPQDIYGTEVFEISGALQKIAVGYASTAVLNDTVAAQKYRALYNSSAKYAAGAKPPTVVACDVATSDVYYSGALLSEAFGNTTKLFTNSSGVYCSTAQEDNATLEVLLRATLAKLVDFTRIIVMRTASDFDRPPPGVSALDNLVYVNQGGFPPAVKNIYLAGIKVVEGILGAWNSTFYQGVAPGNYVGDIFNSLGGKPDFGLPSKFINPSMKKRALGEETAAVLPQMNGRMRMKMAGMRREAMLGGPVAARTVAGHGAQRRPRS